MAAVDLNEAGLALVATYRQHGGADSVCRCASCKTVRRCNLDPKPIVRPMCCGQEAAWQGDPVIGSIGYVCATCGGRVNA